MFKRIGLFLFVNFLVMITVSIILNLLGIGRYSAQMGMNYSGLLVICFVYGIVGSFISLMLSKWMAKHFMGVQLVTATGAHAELVQTVHRLARRAGLTEMPEVGIYQNETLNAFATGPTRNNSLVAVSTGLLMNMNQDELEGVLAHEVAHIANGDMVTLALIQGLMNAFVMFFSRVIAHLIDQSVRSNDRDGEGLGPMAYFFLVFVLDIIFGILASIVVAAFSRFREYRADKGGADLAGKEKMIMALQCLDRFYPNLEESKEDNQQRNFQSMQISAKNSWLFFFFFSSTIKRQNQFS
jgi:heat shock protein HtpX